MRPVRITAASLVATTLLLLAGCSAEPSGAAAGPGEPVTGGSLTWAVETEPITFNPHQYAQAKTRLLVWNTFEALLTHDDKGGYLPWLASGYQVSPDGRTYTFELRGDVTFTDGTRFDAAAVKANIDQLRTEGYAPTVAAVQLKNLDRVEVKDDTTVVFHLSRPDVLLLDFLSSPQGAQVSPRSLREARNLKAGGPELAGTGPFVLDRYTPGQEVHFRRNPAYHWAPANAGHTGPAYLDEITYRFLKESSVRVGALTSGQVQVIEGVPATDEALISANRNLVLRRGLNSGSAYSYYFNTAHAPFDDPRVRQAFREAVDVPAVLAGVYRDTATRAWSVIGPTSPFYDRTLEGSYGGNAAEANELLDRAGWATRDAQGYRTRDGRRLTVRLVQSAPFVRDRRDVLAQAVQAAVKQSAGIDLQVRLVDQGTATQALADGEYEVFDNSRADTDAGAALNLLLHSTGAINRTGVRSAELDRLLDAGVASTDAAKRTAAYRTLQRRVVIEQALALPLYAPQDQIAAARTVGGIGFEPTAGVPVSAYHLWLAQ
ncbi:ABC transporter substrate-binding protein [Actinoplanes teichomyceticus]|uniref:Peptide/nickel transport system substrate-binding protein n=1 Tax=Actinoplanes teichomyceticus TaxID=1867 RepID=A0A561WL94_ACTTI|nr:ABC transporter substrate-binding protein [Actinoplanes teichomyceticus]TWG24615.1 peptide/nickel transport system substrate-binding protein [Actinoplanes teichomyceticus]GIF14722.1 peptide ABC transporter substrate-binding protein [Actinoplanes teichomyceticus]